MAESEDCLCGHIFDEEGMKWLYTRICPTHMIAMNRRNTPDKSALIPTLPKGLPDATQSKSTAR